MTRTWSHAASVLLLLCVWGGTARAGEAPSLDVKDAWIRWLPAGLPGAGYMTVTNPGSVERVLVGADSPDFGEVGIHQSRVANGMNSMLPVASLALAPHATLRFAEGGYHLMLMRPRRDLHPGDRVTVVLHLQDGGAVAVEFRVRGG